MYQLNLHNYLIICMLLRIKDQFSPKSEKKKEKRRLEKEKKQKTLDEEDLLLLLYLLSSMINMYSNNEYPRLHRQRFIPYLRLRLPHAQDNDLTFACHMHMHRTTTLPLPAPATRQRHMRLHASPFIQRPYLPLTATGSGIRLQIRCTMTTTTTSHSVTTIRYYTDCHTMRFTSFLGFSLFLDFFFGKCLCCIFFI
jgi:hypothetical protein